MHKQPIILAPSLLAADFTKLGSDVTQAFDLGADWLHFDVMDGNFVPNISFGASLLQHMRPLTDKVIDAHLMVECPEAWLEDFAKAGADYITIHAETSAHLDRALQQIRNLGCKAGLALTPQTSEECLTYLMDKLDLILVMTVNPGFGGQQFLPSQLPKIDRIRQMIGTRDIQLQVDGGITPQTAPLVLKAGANNLVAGSALFGGDMPSKFAAFKAVIAGQQ